MPMKYYVIAGETSGDLHGANLIKSLKEKDIDAEFRIVGGDQMQLASDQTALIHSSEMAFMGLIEVLRNLRSISKNLKKVKRDLQEAKPDVLILIDFPGFNLKVAAFAKKLGLRVFYYISPKIWAWNQKRVYKIKQLVDHMFCILPFEVDFYQQFNYRVDYVGNPLLDAIDSYQFQADFRLKNQLGPLPIIALLPGSRKMEIEHLLPEMVELYFKFPGHQLIVAGAPNFDRALYERYIGELPIEVIFDQTYDLLKNADAAVVTSGTATLETALLRVPQVVVYKANPITVAVARQVVRVSFISLVNLINNYLSVIELIQKECTSHNIAEELDRLVNDAAHRSSILENYDVLREKMGDPGASERTASLIFNYLKKEH